MSTPKVKSHFARRDLWMTRAGEWVLYALAWSLRRLTQPFGLWTVSAMLAPVGATAMMLIPSVRRRALENLAFVWPEKSHEERRAIAWEAAGQFTRLCAEYAGLDKLVHGAEIRAQGLDHLAACKASGRGMILVSAHYGNWEAARVAAKRAGCEIGIIYRAFNNRYLDRYTMDLIPVAGNPVLQKGRQGMRQLVGHVTGGGAVLILVDQRNSGAPWMDFLGKPAETVTAAADLAQRTGAALIPTRAVRNVSERRFEVSFEPPVTAETPKKMMRQVNDRISSWIEEHPGQWFWFHRRWRSTLRSRPKEE
ncbi:MAG: lysophospholipid acyltransferase family protein [Paracoccaceae bacterium]